jgi:hypothetical protein
MVVGGKCRAVMVVVVCDGQGLGLSLMLVYDKGNEN